MNTKKYLHSLFFTFALLCFVNKANSQVVINEYSCANRTVLDNFANTPDWIELYNKGLSTISLGGYHLSDKRANPLKYTIPSGITIPTHGYLLVWASGKNTIVGGSVHTNFKLTQTYPDPIIFSDSLGAIIDSFAIKPTLAGHSRGLTTDGAFTWSVFTTPTPGATNTGAMQEYEPRPVFTSIPSSTTPNFYSTSVTVTITSTDPFAIIHFTIDGSTPTLASPLYTTPLPINMTTVVRARAFSSNPLVPTSFVRSNTYFIGTTHTVPVVSIFGDSIATLMAGTQFSPTTALQYFDKTKKLKAETEGVANKHGNDSWAYAERGIDFISDDELGYNYAVNTKLFVNKSRASFQRIILKSAANDNYPFGTSGQPTTPPCHIRDSYVHTLSQRGNLYLDERTWSPCVLYVNGAYWGVYDIREKVDDNDFTDYYYKQGDKDSLQFLQTWGGTWSAYGGPQAQTDWNTLKTFITTNNMAVPSNYAFVDSMLNIKSFVDYFLLNSWAVTSDWLNWNTGWWRGLRPEGHEHKWRYTLWDNDATFGHYINYTGVGSQQPDAAPCNPQTLSDPGGQGHTTILDSLLNNPTFKNYYYTRYADLLNTTFSCDFATALLDSMTVGSGTFPGIIGPEMDLQCARWGGTKDDWKLNVDTMRMFIDARCAAMATGIDTCFGLTGPYGLTVDVWPAHAGTVTMNSITPDNYIWSGNYYGNIITHFKGNAMPGYLFDHWEFQNHNPLPNVISDTVNVTFHTGDHILAVFREFDEPQGGSVSGVPTAFSPNNDGNNDVLYVYGSVYNMTFEIFNRWGQKVFSTTDRMYGWDGTFDGKALNPDVFAWRLTGTLANGKDVVEKGNVTLVR